MSNMVVKQIQGKAYWAKFKDPVENFNKDGYEHSVDLAIDEATVKELKSLGLGPKIKDNKEYSPYITFRRATVKKSGPKAGQPNEPIRLVGPDGKTEWDRNVLIGNGSTLNVKFSVNEVIGGPAKKKFIRQDILSAQVYEYVPYVSVKGDKAEFEANPEVKELKAVGDSW